MNMYAWFASQDDADIEAIMAAAGRSWEHNDAYDESVSIVHRQLDCISTSSENYP
jgi:hypothetical protein